MPRTPPTADLIQGYSADLGLGLTESKAGAIATEIADRLPLDHHRSSPRNVGVRYPVERLTFDPGPETDPLNAYVSRFSRVDSTADGALSDLSVAVKDNMAVAGVPMTCGTQTLSHLVPQSNATVVERLLDTGATITGKTNMDALAYGPTGETSDFGPAINPAAEGHVTGGSSSGAAALVAAGEVDAALGSDTGGSVRNPAAFCGVVGFKPTWGVVPRFGFVELSYTLDHIGVLAGDVPTVARVTDAIAGPDERDQSSLATRWEAATSLASAAENPPPLTEFTLGVLEEGFVDGVKESVRRQVREAVAAFEDEGVAVESVSAPATSDAVPVGRTITKTEFAATVRSAGAPIWRQTEYDLAWQESLAAALRTRPSEFTDFAKRAILEGTYVTEACDGQPYLRAQNERARITSNLVNALTDVDVLVTPSMPILPPALGKWPNDPNRDSTVPLPYHSYPANLAGAPSLSLPAGDVDGLPVGLQLTGAPGDDDTVLAVARGLQGV